MRRRLPFVLVLALATSLVGCDQATKHLARTRLTGGAPMTLVRGALDLRLRENVGAAFSLLGDLPAAVRRPVLLAFPLVATPLLVLLLWRRRRAAWPTTLGLALVLGGTVGNLLDRALRDGRVTDVHRANNMRAAAPPRVPPPPRPTSHKIRSVTSATFPALATDAAAGPAQGSARAAGGGGAAGGRQAAST
jgi:signal peptidase II